MDYINSDQLLFITASAGNGGHRLGRIISCIDNVYWYANEKINGINPWDIFPSDLVKGKNISPYHFDRITDKGVIPLLGERAERYWLEDDLDTFYNQKWPAAMASAGADQIINSGKYVLWVLHDTPQYLLTRFSNAKIINLIDTDIDYVIDRYLTTTALFPITINNKSIKPDYVNLYSIILEDLKAINPDPTYRDYWAWERYNIPVYLEEMNFDYRSYVSDLINKQHNARIKENPKYINVTWDNLNIDLIIDYLDASSINKNYIELLH